MTTSTPSNGEIAQAARTAACRLTSEPLALIRRGGDNHVYRAGSFVIRVGQPGRDTNRDFTIARLLASAGIECPEPVGDPELVGALPVAIWHYIPNDPSGRVDYEKVGATIAALHRLPVAMFDSLDGLPWCGDAPWLDVPRHLQLIADRHLLGASDLAILRAAWDRLRDWQEHARKDAQTAICHGDLHPQNILAGVDGPVIVDWDNLCVGPAAWDHAALLTWAERWDGDPSIYPAFASGYGENLSKSSLARLLADVRLLAPTVNKIIDGENDRSRAQEAGIRMRYWRGEVDPPAWTPQ